MLKLLYHHKKIANQQSENSVTSKKTKVKFSIRNRVDKAGWLLLFMDTNVHIDINIISVYLLG